MKFFSKKTDDDFLLLTEADEEGFVGVNKNSRSNPTALTPDELMGNRPREVSEQGNPNSALEALKKRLNSINEEGDIIDIAEPSKQPEEKLTAEIPSLFEKQTPLIPEEKPSLVDKCSPYFVDDEGKDISFSREPLYKLQSVADILKSDSEDSIKRLQEKYGLTIEDTTPKKEEVKPFKVVEELKTEEEAKPAPKAVISDIDNSTASFPKVHLPVSQNTQTITFTPINSNSSDKKWTVTTKTQQIDLTGELVKISDTPSETTSSTVKLQENEFEEFVPKLEASDRSEIKKLGRKLAISKRNSFITAAASIILTLVLSIAELPFLSGVLLRWSSVSMWVCTAITAVIVLLNGSMFKDLAHIFKKSSGADTAASLASVLTLIYAGFASAQGEFITSILIMLSLSLCFRAIAVFRKDSYMLSNFKIACSNHQKKAIKLISDPAVTFSMAKDSVDGDTLIAAAQNTDRITDFMKYSTFGSFLGGKMPIITVLSLLLSAVTGIACLLYFKSALSGIYAAASIQCLVCLPCLFFIDNLPLYSTAKRLNKMGAMIAGKAGAEHIEKANAMVLNSIDLFPKGTVTLHQMKVLSENDLEDTLIRAASLTEYVSSPLAPIFRQIINTGNISTLPDTDTVKYEDRLGISGWVDNRLLFIGNRTLMETHGIEVPPVEVDRKILRQGYFPVYVATREKACAMLMIQYGVDGATAKELRRLTGIGITLLINNTDPNLTEEMICDYLGLYSDSVKVMSAAGCHMYKNISRNARTCAAPAAYRGKNLALAAILNCATRIKRSNMLLTAAFIICCVLGAIIFAYSSFGGSGTLIKDSVILAYGMITTVISYLIYLTERP